MQRHKTLICPNRIANSDAGLAPQAMGLQAIRWEPKALQSLQRILTMRKLPPHVPLYISIGVGPVVVSGASIESLLLHDPATV